jgi:surface protein
MEDQIQVKPMVIPPIENVKVNKTELVYDLPAGDDYIVTLPVWGYANYYVNWGDGNHTETFTTTTVNSSNFPSKTLAGGRKYTIKVWGKIWRYGNFGVLSNEYLIEVKKIGPLDLTSAFRQASNLVKVPKRLPCGVYDLSYMFMGCSVFNQPLDKWDVSSVSNMAGMFENATNFNQPLDKWDVSSVTNMEIMFSDATNFNQPLNNWNVSKVITISGMFYSASNFNQSLNNWNISNVTTMNSMFFSASNFNQPLDKWDVSNVTSIGAMFRYATSFNQPLNNWDVTNVNIIGSMFFGATSFNQPLNNWNVSNVISMFEMFKGATSFNQPINNWNVSKVDDMRYMFKNATSFNQSLNNWNVSNVTNMASMFENAISFNQPLHNWNWTRITTSANMSSMLDYCGMSQYNYQLTLMGWYNIFNANILPANINGVSFGAKGLVYNNDRIIINSDPLVTAHDNEYFTPLNDIAVSFDL